MDYVYTSELIIVLYPLYGDILDDFTIVTITNNNEESARIVIESEIVGYTSMAIDTVDVEPYETVEIRQNPLLIPEVIDDLNAQKPADFHLRVSYLEQGEKLQILDQTHETLVYARRDFPWAIEGFTSEEVYDLLASMVMPNDPAVEELLRAATDYTNSGIIWSGYSGATNDEDGKVWDRLEAIWEAEAEVYDLIYVDTPVDFTPGSVQRIRLPAEVIEQRSGNCIELALLYASAAEALRLEAAIILVPGHAFVAIRTDQESAIYYPIETTMIGHSRLRGSRRSWQSAVRQSIGESRTNRRGHILRLGDRMEHAARLVSTRCPGDKLVTNLMSCKKISMPGHSYIQKRKSTQCTRSPLYIFRIKASSKVKN